MSKDNKRPRFEGRFNVLGRNKVDSSATSKRRKTRVPRIGTLRDKFPFRSPNRQNRNPENRRPS